MLHPVRARQGYLALMIMIVALIVRLMFVVIGPSPPEIAGRDEASYRAFAREIAYGENDGQIAFRPPLYPAFLAAVFITMGDNETTVFCVQALVGALAAGMFFLIAHRLMNETRAVLAGLLYTFFPHLLVFTSLWLTEALYPALIVYLLAALILPGNLVPSYMRWVVLGVMVGLLLLLRRQEAALSAVTVISLITWVPSLGERWVRGVVLLVLGSLLLVGPYLVHNWHLLGTPTLSTALGRNLLVGNNPNADGGYTALPQSISEQLVGMSETEVDKQTRTLALNWMRENPADVLLLLPQKLFKLMSLPNHLVFAVADVALLVLCLFGVRRLWDRGDGWYIILILNSVYLLVVIVTSLVFFGAWRFRMPAYPALLLLAAYGIPQSWLDWVEQRVMHQLRKLPQF